MDKREKEMRTVYEMIHLYCRKNHKDKELRQECLDLYEYAKMRIEKCPFMEIKTFCSQCKVHCYKKDKREQIRKVMRFSGPRMLLYYPLMAIRHLYYQITDK